MLSTTFYIIQIIVCVILMIILGATCWQLALAKNRIGGWWALWGFVFGLIPLVVLLFLPKKIGTSTKTA